MGIFDFLAGGTQPTMGSDAASTAYAQQQSAAGVPGIADLLADPNVQLALGQAGAALSQGKGVGEALGGAAGTMVQNKAAQQAATQQQTQERNEREAFLRMLQGPMGDKLVGPPEDLNTADKITIGPDRIDLSYGNRNASAPPETTSFSGEQPPLEMRRPQAASSTGAMSNQGAQAPAPIDYRGLNMEQIQALSQMREGPAARNQQLFRDYYQTQQRGQELQGKQEEARRVATTAAQRAQEAATLKFHRDRMMKRMEDNLGRRLTPEEKLQADANLKATEALTQQRLATAKAAGTPGSGFDRYKEATKTREEEKLKLRQRAEARAISAAEAEAQDLNFRLIIDPGEVTNATKMYANRANLEPGSTVLYYETGAGWGDGAHRMEAWNLPPEINGQPIDAPTMVRKARELGMKLPDFVALVKQKLAAAGGQ